jgi:replicative DNA helicase
MKKGKADKSGYDIKDVMSFGSAQDLALHKVPPHSPELEVNVLGGMIICNPLIDIALAKNVTPDFFYAAKNAIIYHAIVKLHSNRDPVDLITLTEELKVKGELDAVGGPAYLAGLTSDFTSSETVNYSLEKMMGYYGKRDLIGLTSQLRDKCFDDSVSFEEIISAIQREIYKLGAKMFKKGPQALGEIADKTMDEVLLIHEKAENKTLIAVPTGYNKLDELTGGFQKSELTIIAGRPSHGKTAFALSVAANAGINVYQLPIGIFSIEMSNRELAMRFIAQDADVDISKFKTGKLGKKEFEAIDEAMIKLKNSRIFIDDSSPLGLFEICAKSRQLKMEHDIAMVIVDYLQIMEVDNSKELLTTKYGVITRGLKQLSKELDIPVVALSQLNRKVEERGGEKRPILSDLRDSGSIEQDADVVIFINRPEVYMSKDDPKFEDFKGRAEIIIGKQRNGPIGECRLVFKHHSARFETMSESKEMRYHSGEETPF